MNAKKNGVVLAVFSAAAVVYAAVALVLTENKDAAFWVGLGVTVFSVLILGLTTAAVSASGEPDSSPVKLSLSVFSGIYVAAVLCVNLLFDVIFHPPLKVFVCIHIVCFALFGAAAALLFAARGEIDRAKKAANGARFETDIILAEFEKAETALRRFPPESRRKPEELLEKIKDEIRFSDNCEGLDLAEQNDRLLEGARSILAEEDNLAEIDQNDLSDLCALMGEVYAAAKERAAQIRLLKGGR